MQSFVYWDFIRQHKMLPMIKPKREIMKNLTIILMIAIIFASCNSTKEKNN